MFVIQGDLEGQKVHFNVKFLKILFSINTNSSKFTNTYFYVILIEESLFGDSFGDSKDILISKSKFQDQDVDSMIFDD